MVYRALGVLLSPHRFYISFAVFHENAGKWSFELMRSKAYPVAADINLIHDFIEENNLQYQVALVTVHTETPGITFNGATIAAITGLPVITNLSELDRELGGNGKFYESCMAKLGIDMKNIDDDNKTICIAFMGILRWREEYNFLSSVTGATRSSIGGAVWTGQEG